MTTPEYKPTEEEQRFLTYYDKLIWETINARAHLKLHEVLESYRSENGYLRELNQSPHFFLFTIKAHFDDALLTLSRILDKHEDSLSVWKFLNFVEQNRKIFSNQAFSQRMKGNQYYKSLVESHTPITLKDIKEDRQKLGSLEEAISKIKELRDEVLAHTDRTLHLKGKIILKKYTFQRKKLYDVIDTLVKILNGYSSAYNSSIFLEKFGGEEDVQSVMEYIRSGIEERDRQLEELKRQTNPTAP